MIIRCDHGRKKNSYFEAVHTHSFIGGKLQDDDGLGGGGGGGWGEGGVGTSRRPARPERGGGVDYFPLKYKAKAGLRERRKKKGGEVALILGGKMGLGIC